VLNASTKSASDVISRNIVAAFYHSLAHPPDRFAYIRNPDEMQFDYVALFLRIFEDAHIRSATQSRFERECFMSIYQFAQLAQ